jgi:Tfp pilus assembly protein PilF
MTRQQGGAKIPIPPRQLARKASRRELLDVSRLIQAGAMKAAEIACRQILEYDDSSAEGWFFLGLIHQDRQDWAGAGDYYRQAIRLDPGLAEAHNNLGVVLQTQEQFQRAERCYREALRLEPHYPEALNNLGNVVLDTGRFEEAEAAYREALRQQPGYVEAIKHLGNVLRAQGRLAEAIECYNRGLALAPDHVLLHTARAMVWIQMGDFVRGWPECEWRLSGVKQPIPHVDRPVWDGSPLAGRTIVIIAEQGLGDTLQFIRFAPEAARRGGNVIVFSTPILSRILASCPGVKRVVTDPRALPDFACYAPVMSLPRILGTTLETIPADLPYLAPEPATSAAWQAELGAKEGFKIGVVWQGNPIHTKDRERSFRLAQLAPVASVPGVRLFSLQKNFGLEQLDEVTGRFEVVELGTRLHDFVDTAAVMQQLDLVISADSSPAHLAGALGAPVWMALPYICDWRWMSERTDTPWYPAMRLFRQRRFGDWDEVFARMAGELGSRLARRSMSPTREVFIP